MEPRTAFERLALVFFRGLLLLLPSWLRDRAADEMALVFLERLRRASGPLGRWLAIARETGGVP